MAIADQDNNSSPRASNNLKVASLRGEAAAASNANCITNPHQSRIEETYTNNSPIAGLGGHLLGGAHSASDMASEMEYAWLEPRHDPIVTDTNFAEIDFENFKNEDLAYAFSCGVSEKSFFFQSIENILYEGFLYTSEIKGNWNICIEESIIGSKIQKKVLLNKVIQIYKKTF